MSGLSPSCPNNGEILDKAAGPAREKLEKQLEKIDFDELDRLIREYVLKKPETPIPADLTPAPFFRLKPENAAQAEYYRRAEAKGRELLGSGKVAMLVVAGQVFYGFFKTISGNELEKLLKDAIVMHCRISYAQFKDVRHL